MDSFRLALAKQGRLRDVESDINYTTQQSDRSDSQENVISHLITRRWFRLIHFWLIGVIVKTTALFGGVRHD